MVLIAVKILFFIIALSPFCLPKTEAGNAQTNNGNSDCYRYPRKKSTCAVVRFLASFPYSEVITKNVYDIWVCKPRFCVNYQD